MLASEQHAGQTPCLDSVTLHSGIQLGHLLQTVLVTVEFSPRDDQNREQYLQITSPERNSVSDMPPLRMFQETGLAPSQ